MSSPSISILIANYDGSEAIQLCVESILSRTHYQNFTIIIGNSPASEIDKPYLAGMFSAGKLSIVHFERDLSHGEALTRLIKYHVYKTPYFITLDSDCEILSGDWIDIMFGQLQGPHDALVAKYREGGLIGDNAIITQTFWLCCALFSTDNYRKIEADDNLPEGMTDFATYPYGKQFRYLPGPGWDRRLGVETGGRLADKLTYDNKFGLITRPLPLDFFDTHVRHYGGISRNHFRPEHPDIAPRWMEIKKRLSELRKIE